MDDVRVFGMEEEAGVFHQLVSRSQGEFDHPAQGGSMGIVGVSRS
jgi:hypothetical protein